MLRHVLAVLALGITVSLTGCGGAEIPEGKEMPASDQVKLLTENLTKPNASNMTLLFSVKRLGELGPAAKEAIPSLQQLRAVAPPDFQKTIDDSIAKIEGTAPVTPPAQ